ncbi:hypothetical protein CARUB_v10028353mg [Capsella rubella]|uniref:TIR domain-containing protein n=1 Tax=Capsella rubella TaxID=81985 RepID=R0GE89_9BRAS|nr:hypothetical protein CARUB_v10028353mg [Capsella rubella]
MASISSSSSNWVYDVFPSFSGEDVRVTFLSHFLKELDRKLIKAFKDNEIERSHSIAPELIRAIRTSKIAVVVFSENYSSSSWCLDELVEIVTCKEESGQLVLPIFYGLDPSHVRKQTGKFGEAFAKSCQIKTEAVKNQWQQALILVANLLGYHSQNFFRPEHLVKLTMRRSKLEKLWEGVQSLTGLKDINLDISRNLKELPDLSMATNLETLYLGYCSSLVEVPSSIQYLNKLKTLDMSFCANLKTFPTGMNLKSLDRLNLMGCSRLRSFPNISTNISKLYMWETSIEELPSNLHLENLTELNMCGLKSEKLWKKVQPLKPLITMLAATSLTRLWLSDISSLVELPSSIQDLSNLKELSITKCINLETLPTRINLESLDILSFSECSRLRSFPNISTNISTLDLGGTSIEEVPWWIENFYKLKYLTLAYCNKLKYVSLRIFNLALLDAARFLDYGAFIEDSFSFNISPSVDDTSSVPENYFSVVKLNFINYFNLDQEALIRQQSVFKHMILIGEEVPSHFIHRTSGTSLAIPLLHTYPSQPSLRFRACVVIDCGSDLSIIGRYSFFIQVRCQFIDKLGNHLASNDWPLSITTTMLGRHLVTFECCSPLNTDNSPPLAELDHAVIQFHLIDYNYSDLKFKGCGIRFLEDAPPSLHSSVVEGDKRNCVTLRGHETEYSDVCGDINVETERSNKGKQGQKKKKKKRKKKKKKGSW